MSNRDDDDSWEPTPVGVPIPTAPDERGVLVPTESPPRQTPPYGTPITPTSTPTPRSVPRMGTAGEYSQQQQKPPNAASARAAFREIRALRTDLANHSQSDQLALQSINAKLSAQDDTLEEQNKVLTEIKVNAAETGTAVKMLIDEVRHKREVQKIKIEGEVTTSVEQEKTKRAQLSGKTKVLIALIAVLSTAVGAFAKWLAG